MLVSVPDGKITPLLEGKGSALQGGGTATGQISPDGKWVAYESNETGEWEVFITTFPAAGGKLQVSRTGGRQPRWRGDGKEIYYLDPHGTLIAVPVTTDPGLLRCSLPIRGPMSLPRTSLCTTSAKMASAFWWTATTALLSFHR